eukprot:TRINITY_DN14705_c0_g1_i3.p3 TRINITY_DN14705_c0_g1~~TRINITY_DN14705_c0_g1_i3.p3  ORF type:complete len:145 (+),score=55.57 TRINITY_DN14705_c0_g1_i3:559-993(+)
MFANVEIKPEQSEEVVGRVVEMVEKMEMFDGCCISSFNHKFLETARKLAGNKIELGYLYDADKFHKLPSIDYISSHGNTANICFLDVNLELSKKLHEKGMGLMAWITGEIPKEEEWYQKMLDADVDVLCVNYPNHLIDYLKKTH